MSGRILLAGSRDAKKLLDLPVRDRLKQIAPDILRNVGVLRASRYQISYRGIYDIDPRKFDPIFLDDDGHYYLAPPEDKAYAFGFFIGTEYGEQSFPTPSDARAMLSKGQKYWGLFLEFEVPKSAIDVAEWRADPRVFANDYLFLKSALSVDLKKVVSGCFGEACYAILSPSDLYQIHVSSTNSGSFVDPLSLRRIARSTAGLERKRLDIESPIRMLVFNRMDYVGGINYFIFNLRYTDKKGKVIERRLSVPTSWTNAERRSKEDIPQPTNWKIEDGSLNFKHPRTGKWNSLPVSLPSKPYVDRLSGRVLYNEIEFSLSDAPFIIEEVDKVLELNFDP